MPEAGPGSLQDSGIARESPDAGIGSEASSLQHPQAVVVACSDCDLPLPDCFGAAAPDVALFRLPAYGHTLPTGFKTLSLSLPRSRKSHWGVTFKVKIRCH